MWWSVGRERRNECCRGENYLASDVGIRAGRLSLWKLDVENQMRVIGFRSCVVCLFVVLSAKSRQQRIPSQLRKR